MRRSSVLAILVVCVGLGLGGYALGVWRSATATVPASPGDQLRAKADALDSVLKDAEGDVSALKAHADLLDEVQKKKLEVESVLQRIRDRGEILSRE